jgi:hypothetical protein
MQNPLVPQLRPDKNGKMVTRHVKADSGAPLSAAAIPVPTVKVSTVTHGDNVEALRDAIREALETRDYDDIQLVSIKELDRYVGALSPSVAKAFRQQLDERPDFGFEDLLISAAQNGIKSDTVSYILFIAQHAIDKHGFDNTWEDDINGTIEYENAFKVMRGLNQFFYQETGRPFPENIFEADEATRGNARAVVELIKKGHRLDLNQIDNDWMGESLALNDVSLGELAMEYPDDIDLIVESLEQDESGKLNSEMLRTAFAMRAESPDNFDRVLSIMKERGTSDAGAVRQVLKADVQSLSSGAL